MKLHIQLFSGFENLVDQLFIKRRFPQQACPYLPCFSQDCIKISFLSFMLKKSSDSYD